VIVLAEELREGKLHAGICAGDAEQSVFLPCLCKKIKLAILEVINYDNCI